MNSFSFSLSGKHIICLSILNDSFAGQSNLACRSLLFITQNVCCQSFLACKVSFEKSADSLMRPPLWVTNCSSLAVFKILTLNSTFGILILMCFGVGLFGFNFCCCCYLQHNDYRCGILLSLIYIVNILFITLLCLDNQQISKSSLDL